MQLLTLILSNIPSILKAILPFRKGHVLDELNGKLPGHAAKFINFHIIIAFIRFVITVSLLFSVLLMDRADCETLHQDHSDVGECKQDLSESFVEKLTDLKEF